MKRSRQRVMMKNDLKLIISLIAILLGLAVIFTVIQDHRRTERQRNENQRLLHNQEGIGKVQAKIQDAFRKHSDLNAHSSSPVIFQDYPSEQDATSIIGPPELTITEGDLLWASGVNPIPVKRTGLNAITVEKNEKYILWQVSSSKWSGFKVDGDGKIRHEETEFELGSF